MNIYRIAMPADVNDIGDYMAVQSNEDRQMYYGCSMSPESIRMLYSKMASNLDKQTFVLVREMVSYDILGFIHLAQANGRIELGIYVSPAKRGKGIGSNLLAVAMLYTFTLMGRDMEMQCINRNYDIQKLISDYDKTTEIFDGERVAIIPNTVENQRKAIQRMGKAIWNF